MAIGQVGVRVTLGAEIGGSIHYFTVGEHLDALRRGVQVVIRPAFGTFGG